MLPLTSLLLTKNNDSTIKSCLNSILSLNSNICVFDLGSKDNTIAICESLKAKITKISTKSRIEACNSAVSQNKNKWIFYIHPWEQLLEGECRITDLILEDCNKAILCNIIEGNIITKEVRLWSKDMNLSFTGEGLEAIITTVPEYEDIFILSKKPELNLNVKGNEFHYYEAFKALKERNYEKFLISSDYYLFYQKNKIISSTMMRYYQGIVKCFIKKDYQKAIEIAIICLTENVLMSEFWCLLGDIYFELKEFNKAISFYENALILGSKRPKSDRWPIHINKYHEHPQEMISKCKEMLSTAIMLPNLST
jgi:tetratricopeptide (TPR) repeat protein